MSQSSLAPVMDFLRLHAPFDQMAPVHLEYMAKRLKLGFYARGESIIAPDEGTADRFFIVKQGRVRGEPESPGADNEPAFELVSGECFPVGALLARRPVHVLTRAAEDTFCFELGREDFDQLLLKSPVFHDFCTRRLANLLDNALRGVQATSASRISEDRSLSTPLRSLIKRDPVTCRPECPVGEGLRHMQSEHIGSLIVVDGDQRPVGVFTLHDVLDRVALPQLALTRPMAEVMTPEPLTVEANARAYEAALVMARHGFGHVCVVDARGRLAGVLSERDLFSLQRVGIVTVSRAIASADSIDTLANLERDVHRLIEQMLAQGASVGQLTQLITTLNDSLTRRVIDLVLAEHGHPSVAFTWLAFGSEGRHEQTLKTDQDNGIIFELPEGGDTESVRRELLPLADKINQALDRCGFPLCPGNIMARNPECCLSVEEWQNRFRRWIDQGTPEHLLNATIFFDLRPLWGDPEPADQLRRWMLGQTERNSRFRRQMAANAMALRPPLGLIRDFVVSSGGDHPHTLDLKTNGIAPFVDAARIISLAHRIPETNTVERLQAAVRARVLREGDAAAWCEAYHFIQLLRMRSHRHQAEQGQALNNYIDPDDLNELDRRILKEAFRQARKLQQKIALEYQL